MGAAWCRLTVNGLRITTTVFQGFWWTYSTLEKMEDYTYNITWQMLSLSQHIPKLNSSTILCFSCNLTCLTFFLNKQLLRRLKNVNTQPSLYFYQSVNWCLSGVGLAASVIFFLWPEFYFFSCIAVVEKSSSYYNYTTILY